jgi:hypothetical protein
MRLFLIFCVISFSAISQIKRVDLQVKTDDKISAHGFSYWQELKIKSTDTSFSLPLHKKNPDVISNLKAGNYTVSVTSVFNTQVDKKINLHKKITLLKFTGLTTIYNKAPDNVSISEQIKLNDTLYIIYNTSRNDENNNVKIGIAKTNTGFTAILFEGLSPKVFSTMQQPKDLYKYVVEFETSAKKTNTIQAETTDNKEVYTIELNKKINSFIIPGTWQGLDKLRAILFAVQNK